MSSTGATAGAASWVEVAAGSASEAVEPPLAPRRVYLQVILLSCLVVAVVAVLGAVASREVAERQAVDDAARQADVFAARVASALTDELVAGDPAAVRKLDELVRQSVLRRSIVRVKFWTPEGRIVYSDERALIGQVFPLSEEDRRMLDHPSQRAEAEVSDLDAPENTYEAGRGKLLEVYKPVLTVSGRPLLFEIYAEYESVISERARRLWLAFGSITLFSVLALVLLLLPVLWRLLGRLGRAQRQREDALADAVEASENERRRIAATLHDGVVQELAAASFVVSGAALRAEQEGHTHLTQSLQAAAESVRGSIGALRSLLVEIYPPSLEQTGLGGALRDLVAGAQSRDVEVRLSLPETPFRLPQADERLVYRIAQEALRNALRHAKAARVDVTLSVGEDVVVLEVADDGRGFDAAAVLAAPPPGHFGLRLMMDGVAQGRGSLSLSTAPGAGCRWRLSVPRP
jgi:two-component system NarL family sensor kinase